jgi:predicted RNase H-like HicB family nuclease
MPQTVVNVLTMARSIVTGMNLSALIERDLTTGLLVGSVPGIPGAHTQGETVEEVQANLAEVIEHLREEGALVPESEYVATMALVVA